MQLYDSHIIENKKLAKDIFKLTIRRIDEEEWRAGNFAMILPEPKPNFFSWRRPFSVFKATESTLEFLIKKVGKITNILGGMSANSRISYIGPLGNIFKLPDQSNTEIFLIAGGLGVAPLHMLSYQLNQLSLNFTLLYGAATSSELIDLSSVQSSNNSIIYATEDDSFGYKGKVTDLFNSISNISISNYYIYICGPFAMLYSFYKNYSSKRAKIQSSVETLMACGFGVCRGCAIPSKDGSYKMACKDGPVFDLEEIDWDLWWQIYQ